jgi:TonB family protein
MTDVADIMPARRLEGPVPQLPETLLAGGQVFLETTVDVDGRVVGTTTLRGTAPLAALVEPAVRQWRFRPSLRVIDNSTNTIRFAFMMPRVARVLVGAVVRAPSLSGSRPGTPPVNLAVADDETPFPVSVPTPSLPLHAFGGGVVLVEVEIDPDGSVVDACLLAAAPPFDEPALAAARQAHFRPSRVDGRAVPAYAYLVFGFPIPLAPDVPEH